MAKNIFPISILAYCKDKPLYAILVSCRSNPQVLSFALLQIVLRSTILPRKKKCNQLRHRESTVWSKPDLDPNIREVRGFLKEIALLSKQRKCFCFCSSDTHYQRCALLVGEPPKRIQAQASVQRFSLIPSVVSKAFCLPFDKPPRASNWLFCISQSLTEENI